MRIKLIAAALTLALSGCGGSSGGSDSDNDNDNANNTDNTPGSGDVMLSGTAAAGAAIIGQVIVKGSAGVTISTEIATDGSYSIDVSSLEAPYMLRAEGRVGGKDYSLHSFAEEADLGETINITPFTDLIVANAAGDLAADFFDSGNFDDLSSEQIDVQEAALQQKLTNVFDALGIDSAIDLLRSSFSADHSGLDAALDIIRIETDTDTHQATITNFIDNQSIVDDITDQDDNTEVLVVDEGLSAAQVDLLAIANQVSALSSLFATSLPSGESLGLLLSEDFLHFDQSKGLFVTEVSTEPELIGVTFSHVTYENYDAETGTATVKFSIHIDGESSSDFETWEMEKDDGTWLFRGNQEIVDSWFVFNCNYRPGQGEPGCGVNVGVEDNNADNTPGAPGTLIASARMTILRDGEPVANSEIYLGAPGEQNTGELVIYDEDYGDDYMGFGASWSEISASVFQAGDVAQIELFTEQLDISSAENPQIDGSATAVQTITRNVYAAPVANASADLFPSVDTATLGRLSEYTVGALDITWTVPTGVAIDEVWLQVRQGNNDVHVDDESATGSSGTTTLTLPASELIDSTADDFTKELRIYGQNSDGQTFLTMYDYEGVDIDISNLTGTWELTGDGFDRDNYNGTFLTVTDTAEFFFFNHDENDTDVCREVGYEYGTYTTSGRSVNTGVVVDTNGCVGIFDEESERTMVFTEMSASTASFYFSDESSEDSLSLQRVVTSGDGIVGAWHEPLDSIDGNGLSLILLFLPDGTFYNMDANPSAPNENDFSYGDYEVDSTSDELIVTDEYNSEDSEETGVSTFGLVINNDKLIIDGDTPNALNRVGESTNL
mgnify:CR=1 FL=1